MELILPITIQDRPAFAAATATLSRASCECNFATVFVWKDVYQSGYARIQDRIIVIGRTVGCLLFPYGAWFAPPELESVRQALSAAADLRLSWGDVPQEYIDAHGDQMKPLYRIACLEAEADYLYKTADLAAVGGHCHQNTRRLLRHFENAYPEARLLPMTAADAPTILALAEHLLQEQQVAGTVSEASAMASAFANFEALGLEGLRLADGTGRTLAFSMWSFTTPEVVDVHFEKAVRSVDGAAQTMRIGVARALVGRAQWINLEQDVGVPGLRRSKRSYCPDHLLNRYWLEPLAGGGS